MQQPEACAVLLLQVALHSQEVQPFAQARRRPPTPAPRRQRWGSCGEKA